MTDGDDDRAFETLAVTEASGPRQEGGFGDDVVPPIHLSSTFELPGVDTDLSLEDVDPDAGEFLYSRLSNPTRHALERRLAALEGGDHGMAFASGTAAISTAMLAVLSPDDHVVAGDDLYAGTRRMLDRLVAEDIGAEVTYVDARDPQNVADALRDETALVWVESPTNPLLTLCDVDAIADLLSDHDALLGVDNTFASPYFQRPLSLGADLVAHSTTKYLNGHSDSVGGALVTDDDDLADTVEFYQQVALGNVLAPFDAYLVSRGTTTLPARMRQHESNAMAVAEYLESHDRVTAVHYPGLESHPQHELAREQMSGFGGILSFELEGTMDDAARFLGSLDVFTLAVSVGGVESLVELPAGMTHEPIPREEREAVGITDTLIRVSVGLEAVEDLLADLDAAFDAVARADAPADD